MITLAVLRRLGVVLMEAHATVAPRGCTDEALRVSDRVDVEIEALFTERALGLLGGGVRIYGEEAISAGRPPIGAGPLILLVDPLDGSNLFREGNPDYACTFALADETGLAAGCIYLPRERALYLACRDGTVLRNDLDVRRATPRGRAVAGRFTGAAAGPSKAALRDNGHPVERLGCTARRLIEVATGDLAGVVKHVSVEHGVARLWGAAAGLLICENLGVPFWLDAERRTLAVGDASVAAILNTQGDVALHRVDLAGVWRAFWAPSHGGPPTADA